jgi:hypothetical protein
VAVFSLRSLAIQMLEATNEEPGERFMLIIFVVLLSIWLLGVIAVCTFCVAAARADRLTSQTFTPNEELGNPFPMPTNATSERRPAA